MTARRAVAGVLLVAGAAAWALAAHALWRTSVPSDLHLPHLEARDYFSAAFLRRSASFDSFVRIDAAIAQVVLVVVLALYARRGARLMRESAAGPIGTGMLLSMLGLGIVWLAQLPFAVAGLWWERRHGLAHQGYVDYVVSNFLGLGGRFLFVCFALLIVMALARVLRQWWWIPGAAAFVGLALLFAFVSPYLLPGVHTARDPALVADGRQLALAEGVAGTRIAVEKVSRQTSAPNAEAAGFGSSRTVVLWDTLLGGRFTRRELRVVLAHELGHHAHHDPLRDVGWFALFALPAALIIALATTPRGGMARPEAVPVALLVLVLLQLVALPLDNLRTRRIEAAADWAALSTTRDPVAARSSFQKLATASLSQPNPPAWDYVLIENHPTFMQRIAMVAAWQQRHPSAAR